MPRSSIPAAVALAALSLAACNKSDRATTAASGICKPFTTAAATAPATPQPGVPPTNVLPAANPDPAAAVDDCLHRWGYTLAAASDPADVVADATVAACGPSLTGWNQSSLATQGGQAVQAPSLMSGQPTNPIAEHYAFAQGRALFYVVQARAGHCPPPPASTPAAKG